MDLNDHEYTLVMKLLNLKSLESRRVRIDLLFIFKSINGITKCPQLLQLINFSAPTKSLKS